MASIINLKIFLCSNITDIQRCLNEFRSMEIKSEGLNESKNKFPETPEIEEYSTTPIPKRIRSALNGDTVTLIIR